MATKLQFDDGAAVVYAEQNGSADDPLVSLEVRSHPKVAAAAASCGAETSGVAIVTLSTDEARQLWIELGRAIKTASGREPEEFSPADHSRSAGL